jgi:uncharacterized DUF497 family protein
MTRFEWDPAKALSNEQKHGISFAIAQHVFDDPAALSEQDRIEGADGRLSVSLTASSCCWSPQNDGQDEVVRIISARRADSKERKRYEKERQKNHI